MRKAFSPFRTDVLDRVRTADRPISADEIHREMNTNAALSTVYRALWFLREQGMIDEIPVSCTTKCGKRNFFVSKEKEHRHFFHCESCHSFIPVPGCTAESMSRKLEKDTGATVTGHVLSFTGICGQCGGKGLIQDPPGSINVLPNTGAFSS